MNDFKEQVLAKISNALVIEKPFKLFEIDELIPEKYYREFISNLPNIKNYNPLMHKQTIVNNKPSRFELSLVHANSEEILRLFNNSKIAMEILQFFSGNQFKDACLQKFEINTEVISYPHLYRDIGGFNLPPHTDIPEKVVTFGWYLPNDNSQNNSGFDVYTKKGTVFNKHRTIPYIPNKAIAFQRSNSSWHGALHIYQILLRKEIACL